MHLDRGVTGGTLGGVRTILIKELHAEIGRWVRAARSTPVVVTDRSERIAVLKPLDESAPVRRFPKRDWSKLPASDLDSTDLISADRDGR